VSPRCAPALSEVYCCGQQRLIFAGFRQEGQHGLETFLAFVLRVVGLASAHLFAVERVHRGVSVQSDRVQLHIGGFPRALAPHALQGQQLLGYLQMQ
jgi:hypothetical protein